MKPILYVSIFAIMALAFPDGVHAGEAATARASVYKKKLFATSTWNGSAWSGGTPDATTDVVIASSVSPGAFTCATITINSGAALTINAGVTVTVAGNITNNGNGLAGTGTIQFSNNGNTIQLLGTAFSFEGVVDVLTGTTLQTNDKITLSASSNTSYGRITGSGGTITGAVTVQKVMSTSGGGWRQISLPVDATIASLTGIDLLTTSHGVSNERNVFYWDPTNIGANTAAGWTQATAADDETKAYTVYSNNGHGGQHDISGTISITGTPNNGTYTINLQYTYDPSGSLVSSVQRGWNFIPNRYASNIDVSALVADGNFGTTYKAVHAYDNATAQYIAINQSSRIAYNNSSSRAIATNDIMPFQGFWVKATSLSQSIQLKNSHRITDLSTSSVFAGRTEQKQLLRLNVSDENGRMDQALVFFNSGATDQLDGTMDMFKLKSPDPSVPTLYCREGELELCANALPVPQTERSVQLMFESRKHGAVYTFDPDFSAYTSALPVAMEDRKTGELHDLSKGKFSFVHDGQFGADRFVLHFTQPAIAKSKASHASK